MPDAGQTPEVTWLKKLRTLLCNMAQDTSTGTIVPYAGIFKLMAPTATRWWTRFTRWVGV